MFGVKLWINLEPKAFKNRGIRARNHANCWVFALESWENPKSHFRRKSFIRNGLRRISRSFVQGITGAVRHARRGPHGRMEASAGHNAEMKGGMGGEGPASKGESVVKMVSVVVVAGRFWLGIVSFLLPLVEFFVHPVLKEPDWISIPSDELVNWQAINCGRPPDTLLLPVDEDRHELTPTAFLLRLFSGTEFSFWLPHDVPDFCYCR